MGCDGDLVDFLQLTFRHEASQKEETMKALQIVMFMIAATLLTEAAWAASLSPADIARAHAKLQSLIKELPGTATKPKAAAPTAAPASAIGWNSKSCVGQFSLVSGNAALIAVLNTDGTEFFSAASNIELSAMQGELIEACSHGGYQIHVVDSSGNFDAVFTPHP